jgi:predicted nucleic acid-binding protein
MLVLASVIALGEVEAGHQMAPTTNKTRRDEYVAELNERFLPTAIGISVKTRLYYAQIIGRLWVKCQPPSSKKKTERHLVEAFSVDINDVWSVAVAWEHGLIFLTHDKIEHIKSVVTDKEVLVDCWLPRK